MLNYLQKRLALSEKGAKEFLTGTFFTYLQYITLMFPMVLLYGFLSEYLPAALSQQSQTVHSASYYAIIGLLLILIMYIIARLQYRSTYSVTYNESAKRRIELAEKLRKLPLAFFKEKNLSDLTSTIMDDCTQLEQVFSHAVPQLFASIALIATAAIALFFYEWHMALALFWVVPISFTVILFSKKRMGTLNKEFYHVKREVTEQIQEGLETVQEMRSYNMEDEFLDSFSNTIKRNERYQIKSELLTGTFINVAYIFLKLGLATVVITGALLLRSSSIDLLTYMMFCLISAHIYNPITEILNNMAVLFYLDVRINRVKAMEAMTTQAGSTEFTPENFTIEFDHVDFSYEEGKQVLTDVSFCAPQGKVTALVGPSGGGKSTAAKLAARFWDIDCGKITLGGIDISTIEPETLLNYYSVVFQDVVLFNASIADNIRIGKKEATDREVMEAARLSQCHEFIQRLPDGYDTVIGENGETLSGGERQRISIARALLKNAPIVLLDEATASVDVENETKIQSGLSNLIRNRTLIIIAHRMRTIRHADNIVVLDGGKVVECGTPQQLGKKNGMFSKMAEIQKLL